MLTRIAPRPDRLIDAEDPSAQGSSAGRRWRGAATALLVVALAAGTSACGQGSGRDDAGAAQANDAIPAEQRASFDILRRERGASDEIRAARAVELTRRRELDLLPGLSRRAQTASRIPMWVVPGRNGLCVLRDSGDTCGSLEQAKQGYLISVATGDAGATVADGLLPDGISSVVVGFDDGTTREVPVRDNVFAVQAREPALSYVSWTGADGETVKRPLPLPPVRP